MAGGEEIILLQPPLGGLRRDSDYQSKPPFYTQRCLNVRAFDTVEGRGRIGSRPGTIKAYAKRLGNSNEGGVSGVGPSSIVASKDTYIRESLPTSNFDSQTTLISTSILRDDEGRFRSLLHFNLTGAGVPVTAQIATAKITFDVSDLTGTPIVGLYRLTQSAWVEAQATWNVYATASSWTDAGGDYAEAGKVVQQCLATGTFQFFGLEDLVRDALASPTYTGQLHLLMAIEGNSYDETIAVRTSENSDSSLRPTLNLTYTTGESGTDFETAEVRLLTECRTLSGVGTVSTYLDNFNTDPLPGAFWDHPSPAWVIDSVTSTGLPTVEGPSEGFAGSVTANELRTAALDTVTQAIGPSATSARELVVVPYNMQANSAIHLLLDLNDATPVLTGSIRLTASFSTDTDTWRLHLYVNNILTSQKTGTTVRAENIGNKPIKLRIQPSGLIECWWHQTSNPDISIVIPSYTPAGGKPAFGLSCGSGGNDVLISSFSYSYTPVSTTKPATMLMASANGFLERETIDGRLSRVTNSGTITLRKDRLLSAANRLQSLYIADYQLRVQGTDGTPNGTAFTSSTVTDWTAITLGTNVIINGGFTSSSDWVPAAGWTVGPAVATASGAISTDLAQTSPPLTAGRRYRVVFTVTRSAGSITPVCGGTSGSAISSSTTSTQDITCGTTGAFKFSTSGFTGTVDNVSAREISADTTIDTDDDVLEIYEAGTGAYLGTYDITAVAAGGLTLGTAASAGAVSGVDYRVVRGAKIYDSATDLLSLVPYSARDVTNAVVSQFPAGCRHFSLWADRIVATNDPLRPHQWFMSAQGYPLVWDYGDSGDILEDGTFSSGLGLTLGVGAAVSDDVAEVEGTLGDPIVCTIPLTNDYLIFACKRSFHLLRGNPRLNGAFDALSRDVGILDIGAHARTPDGRLLVMTLDGIYEVTLQSVIPLSRDVIPQELIGLDPERYEVTMGYDFNKRGIVISAVARTVSGNATVSPIVYFYDLRTGGFFLDEHSSDHDATAMFAHQINAVGPAVLIRGCRDGYLRQYSDSAETDDGTTFDSNVLYGPVRLGDGEYGEGYLMQIIDVLDRESGDITLQAYVGHSAQAALDNDARYETIMNAGRNRNRWPRLRGGAVYIDSIGTPGQRWARESLTITRQKAGRLLKT